MRILVVEDDKKVASFVLNGLKEEFYAVDVAYDGEEGQRLALEVPYDLVILDLMLPKVPGSEILRSLRSRKPNIPILVLTAKSSVEDRVAGLDLGADDYLVKPFAFAELSARIRVLLRRGARESSQLTMADLTLDTATRTVKRGGTPIEVSAKEFSMLEFLLRHARRPVTRTMLIEHVWDIHFDTGSNIVDVHINHLRNKIDRGFNVQLIHTVRGVGYMLSDERR